MEFFRKSVKEDKRTIRAEKKRKKRESKNGRGENERIFLKKRERERESLCSLDGYCTVMVALSDSMYTLKSTNVLQIGNL